jgi:hypothetical protein
MGTPNKSSRASTDTPDWLEAVINVTFVVTIVAGVLWLGWSVHSWLAIMFPSEMTLLPTHTERGLLGHTIYRGGSSYFFLAYAVLTIGFGIYFISLIIRDYLIKRRTRY